MSTSWHIQSAQFQVLSLTTDRYTFELIEGIV